MTAGGNVSERVRPGFDMLVTGQDPPNFLSPRVAAFYAYWQRLCADRPMPRRADFDPAAIRTLLPYVLLVDIVEGRARYRLVGTAVVDISKLDFTGQFADELDFKEVESFDYAACYRQVAEARVPGLGHSAMLVADVQVRWTEFVICPLSDDGDSITQCMVLEDYEPLGLIERDSLIPAVRR